MAVAEKRSSVKRTGLSVDRHSDQSDPDAPVTVATPTGETRKLLFVTVKYSANGSRNVPITLKSGAGDAFDTLMMTIVITSKKDGIWIPEQDVKFCDDDALEVVAPTGGVAVTCAVAIQTEVL